MDPSTELANLEAENGRRLDDLMAGRTGAAVSLQPGTFELMQLTVYLEHVLTWIGEQTDRDELGDARMHFAERANIAINKLEQAARQAQITHGSGSSVNGTPHLR